MIRNRLIQRIYDALEKRPYLLLEDFQVSCTSEYDITNLNIVYCLDIESYFRAEIPPQRSKLSVPGTNILGLSTQTVQYEYDIKAMFCPGEISLREEAKLSDADELISAIRAWIKRLADDIENQPAIRKLEEQQGRLEELKRVVETIADEIPTEEEVQDIKASLEEMINNLRIRLEQLEDQDREQSVRIEELTQQLEILLQRVETTSKRGIVRAFLARVYSVASDPKFSQLIDNAQKIAGLLGGSPPIN